MGEEYLICERSLNIIYTLLEFFRFVDSKHTQPQLTQINYNLLKFCSNFLLPLKPSQFCILTHTHAHLFFSNDYSHAVISLLTTVYVLLLTFILMQDIEKITCLSTKDEEKCKHVFWVYTCYVSQEKCVFFYKVIRLLWKHRYTFIVIALRQ